MKRILIHCITAIIFLQSATAQVITTDKDFTSPYHISVLKDGAVIAGGVGLTALGVSLIANKRDLTPAELASKTRDKIPFFDRSSAGFYAGKS